ncbi:MAG TPA: hypothetical protein V6D46_02320, partial [Coleofasciculaceae cyanobacterium]
GRDVNSHTEMTGVNTSNRLADITNLATHENRVEEGATGGAVAGGTLGGVTGLLVGLGLVAIPGIGPVMLAGATATAIASTISGSVIGAVSGGLVGGLVGLGLPEDRAKIYHDRVAKGDYLVIVEGSADDIAKAESILSHRKIHEWYTYNLPGENLPGENFPGEVEPLSTSASTRHPEI